MLYNSKHRIELRKMFMYIRKLIKSNSIIEVINKSKRTISQNSYLHVLFGLYGIEYGWKLKEAKTVIKRELGYYYEKNGEKFLFKTSEMTTKEMSVFIDKFLKFASEQGCLLPDANEHKDNFSYYHNEIEKMQKYL